MGFIHKWKTAEAQRYSTNETASCYDASMFYECIHKRTYRSYSDLQSCFNSVDAGAALSHILQLSLGILTLNNIKITALLLILDLKLVVFHTHSQ